MNEQDAYNLIVKVLSGEASESEKTLLDKWRQSDPENEQLFLQVNIIWNNSSSSVSEPDLNKAWDKVKIQIRNKPVYSIRFYNTRIFRIAASIIFITALSIIFYLNTNSRTITVETALHETKQVELTDGSKITLNENSRIRFSASMNGKERKVELQGEAFFDVTKNPDKPFIIHSGKSITRVLGTSFIIRSFTNDTADVLSVFSGKVEFKSVSKDKSVVVVAGEKAFISDINVNKSVTINDNQFAWKTKKLVFNNSELKDVFKTLEEFYRVKISVSNKSILKCHFTGEFNDALLKNILNALCKTLNLSYERVNNHIHMKGDGC